MTRLSVSATSSESQAGERDREKRGSLSGPSFALDAGQRTTLAELAVAASRATDRRAATASTVTTTRPYSSLLFIPSLAPIASSLFEPMSAAAPNPGSAPAAPDTAAVPATPPAPAVSPLPVPPATASSSSLPGATPVTPASLISALLGSGPGLQLVPTPQARAEADAAAAAAKTQEEEQQRASSATRQTTSLARGQVGHEAAKWLYEAQHALETGNISQVRVLRISLSRHSRGRSCWALPLVVDSCLSALTHRR